MSTSSSCTSLQMRNTLEQLTLTVKIQLTLNHCACLWLLAKSLRGIFRGLHSFEILLSILQVLIKGKNNDNNCCSCGGIAELSPAAAKALCCTHEKLGCCWNQVALYLWATLQAVSLFFCSESCHHLPEKQLPWSVSNLSSKTRSQPTLNSLLAVKIL